MGEAEARYATQRTPERATRGPEVVAHMRRLGFEPLPWQSQVLDVALEVDEAGRLVYSEVTLVVPRRAGKTVIDLALICHRAHDFGVPQVSISTAQTGLAARTMFRNTWVPTLERTAYQDTFEPRFQNGAEQISWANGSVHLVSAPNERAGHGADTDLVIIDEAWSLQNFELEQGLAPTQATRVDSQFWITSAAGNSKSTYLLSKMELGRTRAEMGMNTGAAYFEWSADPAADTTDPETWRRTHPALGHTIPEAKLAGYQASMEASEFARAFLCVWPGKGAVSIIPETNWNACEDPASRITGPVWLALDLSPDRVEATISAAGYRQDGLPHVEVLRSDRGTAWIIPFLRQVTARNKPAGLVIDSKGAAGSLIPELQRHALDHTVIGLNDVVRGAGAFYDAAMDGTLRHIGQIGLTTSVYGATKRHIGAAWAFGRTVGVDLTPLVSASNALWALVQPPPEAPKPFGWSIL